MFGYTKKIAALEERNAELEAINEKLYKELKDEKELREKQWDEADIRIARLKDECEYSIECLKAGLELKVSQKTQALNKANQALTIENGVLKKEVEILNKAFESMGYDVKDTKEIIGKLVEALATKNTVNVLK
jgi:hypothetical protein